MSLLHPKTIEEHVVSAVKDSPKKTTDLLEELRSSMPVTKQGFYASLRKLKKEEAVVVYKSVVALNTAWIERLIAWTADAQAAYLPQTGESTVLDLKEKESVSYTFTTTAHLDTFWGHTQNILVQETPPNEAVYSYDPHYWFYLARKETEKVLIATITGKGKQFLMTVGGTTALDKALQPEFTGDERQYHMERLFPKKNYYLVVIGSYVTEVFLDEAVAEKVENIYETHTDLNSSALSELTALLSVRARHRIKISRNSLRAKKLKTKLQKPFFIKNESLPDLFD